MTRYNVTSDNTGTMYNGKRFFRTTSYPPILVDPSDTYITATTEDFLDALAYRFYKDSTLWWVIAQANQIKGTLKPMPGRQLRIPGNINLILAKFNAANQ